VRCEQLSCPLQSMNLILCVYKKLDNKIINKRRVGGCIPKERVNHVYPVVMRD
jgi:hypothetical protein